VRFTLKEARLQTPVPTNRNWIRRLCRSDEVAHHTDVLSGRKLSSTCAVDPVDIGGRNMPLPGEILTRVSSVRKSAEAIVVTGNKP